MFVNTQQLSELQVMNQDIPPEGSRAVQLNLDFTSTTSIEVDFSQAQQQTRISTVQTLWIDLSQTDSPLMVVVEGTGQILVAKGRTQGLYSIIANAPTKLLFSSAAGVFLRPIAMNVPMAGVVWPTQ